MPIDSPPSGFHDLGWQGLQLRLPNDWNLSAFHGTASKGSLAISDLRDPRLMARWHKPRHWPPRTGIAQRQFQTLSAKLRRRQPAAQFSPLAPDALQIDLSSGERLLLAHDHDRLFEIHWPERPPPEDFLAAAFLSSMHEAPTIWQWQAFGLSGNVPPYARIRNASLLPGAPQITLVRANTAYTLGALSLADRLLQNSTLKQAAEKHLRLANLPGEWSELSDTGMLFHGNAPRRFLPGMIYFRFVISHDAQTNHIRWNLTTRPGFHKIWRSR